MKKCLTFLLTILVIAQFSACERHSSEKVPTWQEQYDLGVRYLSEGNYEEAIIAFTAAIEIDPRQAQAYVGRGDAYVKSGGTEDNLTAARADYEKAVELDDSIVDAYLALADIYLQQGDTEAAIAILEQGYQATGDETLNSRRKALDRSGDNEVVWTDEVFERLIRDKLDIPAGPIYVRDLDGIINLHIYGDVVVMVNEETENLSGGYRYLEWAGDTSGRLVAYYGTGETEYTTKGGIANVDALQYFRNLVGVEIVANHITDISVLDQMDSLEWANFWGNEITDLSPLERLPQKNSLTEEQFVEIGDILFQQFGTG